MQKEFKRYMNAVRAGEHKAAKGASEEMRRWGGFDFDDDEKIKKEDIGEKTFVLMVDFGDSAFKIDLAKPFEIPMDQRDEIIKRMESQYSEMMINQLAKDATDAEFTEVKP